ncbi:extracellular solute-binding protein [Clostridium sp. SHJSY1]|uniref:extracellular solute-binding protein n=1 Tax=Clostridium sp. SHJSY1 TaxID=2942483 RepID=UPI0028759C75|nr:extracellular solute-binding protein [Clostridium sp. SHJSY1]MDS0525652.1 extracellular solute-binding protein [Clostridium sp. SHJSY1]
MKNKKIALILVGILSTSILAGCGSSKSSSSSADDKKITIMAPVVSADPPAADNQLEKKLEELTGYDVEITWVPNSSYADKVSITMASDNVPELMVIQGKDAATISNVKKGAFWKLDDYLKDYDNLSKYDEQLRLNASFNGDTYGVYRKRDVIRSNVAIRKDWLDKLGLKVPTTIEEFNNVLDKFTNGDPDGNGVNDTTGMVIPKWPGALNSNSPFDQMAVWFGAPNTTIIKDDKVVPDFMTDEYMKSLDYFKMLYDKGYMNKDFAVLDSNNWDDPFVNGKAGILVDTQSRTMDKLAKKMIEKYGDDGKHGDSYITMVGDITTDAGDHILPTTGYSGMLMVPKQSVKDEKHLKKVLDFMDKLNSKDVTYLLNNGIEGTYYEMKDGKYTPTTDKTLLNDIAAYSQLSTNTQSFDILKVEYDNKLEADRNEIMKNGEKKAVFDPCASLISDVYASKGAQLQNIMSDARIQYIAGQIDKDGYKAAQKQWLSTGGQEYIDELTKLYNEKIKK